MTTAIACILHLLVDGVCALSMMGLLSHGQDVLLSFLLYNFCAFALQMPIGLLLDYVTLKYLEESLLADNREKGNRAQRMRLFLPSIVAMLGILFTLVGAVLHPVLLGIGNACFHIGAGVQVIGHDKEKKRQGMELGFFVAPGAMGLFGGKVIAACGIPDLTVKVLLYAGIVMILLGILMVGLHYRNIQQSQISQMGSELFVHIDAQGNPANEEGQSLKKDAGISLIDRKKFLFIAALFVIVGIRSFAGMGLNILSGVSGKGWFSVMAVTAVVLGKMLGGVWNRFWGEKKVIILSFSFAALFFGLNELCILLGEKTSTVGAIFGIIAFLFFNMSMPITLYALIRRFSQLPGFWFGLLTFGLFLGYIPVVLGYQAGTMSGLAGLVISLCSMLLFLLGLRVIGKEA